MTRIRREQSMSTRSYIDPVSTLIKRTDGFSEQRDFLGTTIPVVAGVGALGYLLRHWYLNKDSKKEVDTTIDENSEKLQSALGLKGVDVKYKPDSAYATGGDKPKVRISTKDLGILSHELGHIREFRDNKGSTFSRLADASSSVASSPWLSALLTAGGVGAQALTDPESGVGSAVHAGARWLVPALSAPVIARELIANIHGFNAVRKAKGLWQAIKETPAYAGNVANYALAPVLSYLVTSKASDIQR